MQQHVGAGTPSPVAYFREQGGPLSPDWVARSPASGFRIACYFADLYRAAPWPKSGGFCVFLAFFHLALCCWIGFRPSVDGGRAASGSAQAAASKHQTQSNRIEDVVFQEAQHLDNQEVIGARTTQLKLEDCEFNKVTGKLFQGVQVFRGKPTLADQLLELVILLIIRIIFGTLI